MRETVKSFEGQVSTVTTFTDRRRRRIKHESEESKGRYQIDFKWFEGWQEQVYRNFSLGKDSPGLSIIDKYLKINIETEKMIRFVQSTLSYDINYLLRLDVVTFMQLLKEADKVQKANARQ